MSENQEEVPGYSGDDELLSNLVFGMMNQAATWSSDVTSTPSMNRTPLITLAR